MLFNSYIFLLAFLPATIVGYFFLHSKSHDKIAQVYLVAMSCLFYGYSNPRYLLLLVGSIAVNYTLVQGMYRIKPVKSRKKLLLILGLLFNIGLLFYFKYYDFFVENINTIFSKDYNLQHVILPLGISFFTFQQISYVIDSVRGEASNYSLLDYMEYVTFFPQLIAGPIVLHEELIPQLKDSANHVVNYQNLSKGLYVFSMGLAKKVLLADNLGKIVNAGIYNLEQYNALEIIIVMLSYAYQLYFDFSGYSDMAIGIGLMFNVQLPCNFNSPYKAYSIGDFWKRWHMTLTRFFTKYVYIPLGGNRRGMLMTMLNTMIVFTLSGLWHGAAWNFILWGSLNGFLICINRLVDDWAKKIPAGVSVTGTFGMNCILWWLFRETNTREWIVVLKALTEKIVRVDGWGRIGEEFYQLFTNSFEVSVLQRLGFRGLFDACPGTPIFLILLLSMIAVWLPQNAYERGQLFGGRRRELVLTAVLMVWSIVSLSQISEFLYFNF